MDLLYIWHDYRYWSKILFSIIPTTWACRLNNSHEMSSFIFSEKKDQNVTKGLNLCKIMPTAIEDFVFISGCKKMLHWLV